MNYTGIIVLAGNDGTGKTTICKQLSEMSSNLHIVERTQPGELPSELAGWLDTQTLKYAFEDREPLPCEYKGLPVYWIILDAPVDALEPRLNTRVSRDVWETHKALEYYRRRFRELSGYYGLPLVDVTQPLEQVCSDVLQLVADAGKLYNQVRAYALQGLTLETIRVRNIENFMYMSEKNESSHDKSDYPPDFPEWALPFATEPLRAHAWARYMVNTCKIYMHPDHTCLRLVCEGESKQVYRPYSTENKWLCNIAIILLKPTVYSHTQQACGEIKDLEKIRAKGTQMFLEMMYRNGLEHSYRSINENGVILSDFVPTVPPTEIVIKKYCEGTDKHSFYGLRDSCLASGEYKSGPYVRFDWRNPNHLDNDGKNPAENPYYYLIEETLGKEIFFKEVLSKSKPLGDKCISSELLKDVIDTKETRKNALKMFLAINAYFNKVGLEIQDCCFMLDRTGTIFWSEINQDCMRIKVVKNSESLDKDIWRAGGSGVKDLLVRKWTDFNQIMYNYFVQNRFHKTEMYNFNQYMYQEQADLVGRDPRLSVSKTYMQLYRELARNFGPRRVIATMDLWNGEPVLVKSGKVSTVHTQDINKAFEHISIFPDVLVVDLNGAFGEPDNNRGVIKALSTKRYIHVGGGIRTIQDVQEILASSARRIVVSSNTDTDFLAKIPKDRLIVELSVDGNGNVLTHGRTVNTKIPVTDKMHELASQGVEAISVTFNQTEGHLRGIPMNQIAMLVLNTPPSIQKIIIAGGITTIEDLEFLWSFPKVIPQLGSAIWTGRITIGQVYAAMMRYSPEAIVPAIIQDTHGRNKGLVYLDEESIRLSCDTRFLHRYSRQHKQVMLKGVTSGNVQRVLQISADCDNDALLVTVDTEHSFCHTEKYSCFSLQTVIKANLGTLTEHIGSRKCAESYTTLMQKNPGFVLAKLMEEFWEIVAAEGDYKRVTVHECADLLVHLIMYLNGHGISMDDILNELNARRWDPKLLKRVSVKPASDTIVLAITAAKYSDKTDNFIKEHLGVRIVRPSGRKMGIEYEIVDHELYKRYFGEKKLEFVGVRPKDMPWLIAFNTVHGAVTYNTVISNYPKVYKTIFEVPDPAVRLALIQNDNSPVPENWTRDAKIAIAAEHPKQVYRYLRDTGFSEETFTLYHILGSSESYIVNPSRRKYALCDAIVETGSTLDANGLSVWGTVLDHGEVKIGLYMHLLQDVVLKSN